jgi:hypothetical protein
MNKREFVAGGVATVVAVPALAREAGGAPAPLQRLLTRTQRLPDLAERAGADTFEAYLGERFDIARGPGAGERLVLTAVERVARCAATEQFDLRFHRTGPATEAHDGLRELVHGTGQRVALHLETGATGYTARFNLLA